MKLRNRIIDQMISDKQGTSEGHFNSSDLLDALLNLKKISFKTHDSNKAMLWADKWFDCCFEHAMDNQTSIFLCSECGWWCEDGDLADVESDEMICGSCGDDF